MNNICKELHLSSKDDVQYWRDKYKYLGNWWVNQDIWRSGYKPDKEEIFQVLKELKVWSNNANWNVMRIYPLVNENGKKITYEMKDDLEYVNCDGVARYIARLDWLCKSFLEWIEDQMVYTDDVNPGWLSGGIQKVQTLSPNSKIFELFINQLSDDLSIIPGAINIKSRGWGEWSHKSIETLDERYDREEKEESIRQQKELRKVHQEQKIKDGIAWVYNQFIKYWSHFDVNTTNIEDQRHVRPIVETGDKWKENTIQLIKKIEKYHLLNPKNRAHSYIYLWQRPNIIK